MTYADFVNSLDNKTAPNGLTEPLLALWYDGQHNWQMAHNITQRQEGTFDYDRVHAYLHRKEGDVFNAKWWYNTLKLPYPTVSLQQEWEELVKQNL